MITILIKVMTAIIYSLVTVYIELVFKTTTLKSISITIVYKSCNCSPPQRNNMYVFSRTEN